MENTSKALVDVTYAPLVFTKRPHSIDGVLQFGSVNDDDELPLNASKMKFSGKAGPSESARDFLLSDNNLTDTDFCPKEVLKFSPIPTSKYCKRSNFENFTSLTHYNLDLQFERMPDWFEFWSNRLDHLVSAFAQQKVESLDMNKQINVSLHTPNDFWLSIEVNGVNWRVYHIPFLQKLDSKYDASHELAYDSGWKRSCSIINGMVNTFDDFLISLPEYHKIVTKPECVTLLAADCSPMPEMAIFLIPWKENDFSSNYGLRVYVGSNYFDFASRNGSISDDDPVYITLNSDPTLINIREKPYEYPVGASAYDFRIELNEQNILMLENPNMHSSIQFNMLNILNFEIYGVYKNKMCGLCSQPLNSLHNYTICN